ncbi:MAG: S8 family serine peptidase [Candidatus Limnocylindria bacterium]
MLLQLIVFVMSIFAPSAAFAQDPTPDPTPVESAEPTAEPTVAPSAEPEPTAIPAPSEPDPTAAPDPTDPPAPSSDPDPTSAPTDPEPSAEPSSAPEAGTRPYVITYVAGTSEARQLEILAAAGVTDVSSIPQLTMRSILLDETDYADQLATLRANADVTRVDLDRVRAVEADPSDTSFADQWALPKIGWSDLYGTVTIGGSATVAVLDTGVDASHPDLDGVVLSGTSVLDGSNGMSDPNGHGTWMAGIVAAETDNGTGIAGTAYAGVSVLPVTVLGADGTGQDSDIISGVVYAADAGADVILMSFSNPGYSSALQAAIDYAWASGAVLVAAAGNDGVSTNTFPAGDRGVIGVASTDASDALAASSNSGDSVFLAAPGVGIATTAAGGGVSSVSGTSASAALVAGAAALLSANEPHLSNGTIVGRLARNADPTLSGGTGNGRLNLARAMADTVSDEVQPAGAAPVGDGGPLVGPYVAVALGVTLQYLQAPDRLVANLTGANGNKTYDVTYTPPAGGGSPILYECVDSPTSGGNVNFSHLHTLGGGYAGGLWSVRVEEFNPGQTCAGRSNKSAEVTATVVVTAGTFSGVVRNDINGNGTNDSDPGLASATVRIYRDANGNGTYETATDLLVHTATTTSTGSIGAWNSGSLAVQVNATYFLVASAANYNATNALPGSGTGTTAIKQANDRIRVVVANISGAFSSGNTFLLTPAMANQTITFEQPTTPATYGSTFNVNPTASSDLPVTVTASGGCTVVQAATGWDVTMTSGTIACVLTASQAGNSSFHPAPNVERTVDVEKKALEITANDRTKTYGSALVLGTSAFTTDGLVNGDTVTAVTLTSDGAAAAAAAGLYDVTPSAATGTGLGNYTITYTDGELDVEKKALTVTANDKSMSLNGLVPALDATITGFVNGQGLSTSGVTGDPTLSTTATSSSAVGTYPITVSIGSLAAANYAFTFVNGTMRVQFAWGGFLQPINDTAHETGLNQSKFKLGQTIPVRFNIKNAAGTIVQQTPNPTFTRSANRGVCDSQTAPETVPVLTPMTDAQFSFNGSHYHYNWSTKGLTAGEYRIYAHLADGTSRYVDICLTK